MAGGGSKAARGGVARASKQLPNPRSEVVRLTERREMLKRDLDILEQQIADFEGSYLKTSPYVRVHSFPSRHPAIVAM